MANASGGNVLAFPVDANGNQPPIAEIGAGITGLRQPMAVAVDAHFDVWALDYANDSLSEFAPGLLGPVLLPPIETISGPQTALGMPVGLAQDGAGHLLVSNQFDAFGASVTEYPNAKPFGDEMPAFVIQRSPGQLDFPGGLDVDAANDLYVANEFGGVNGFGQLNVFAPGGTSPEAVISGPATSGLASPGGWRNA